jgi:hypothetical protein
LSASPATWGSMCSLGLNRPMLAYVNVSLLATWLLPTRIKYNLLL